MIDPRIQPVIIFVIVAFAVIVLGIALIIILSAIFYRYKLLNKRLQQRREQMRGDSERELEEQMEEQSHEEASTHRGEPPPNYSEAVVSQDYINLSVESLNRLSFVEDTTSETLTENETRETNSTEVPPPPYISN